MRLSARSHKAIAGSVVVVAALGVLLWWVVPHLRNPQAKPPQQSGRRAAKLKTKPDPLRPAILAYNKGRYKDAETKAQRIIESAAGSKDTAKKKDAVRAQYILAFAAARQRKMELARERFRTLKEEAAKLPDHGKQDPQPNTEPPTLEEEGAYQHAVCTAALGDKKAAEAEYLAFMKNYPDSPLIYAAAGRIERLHGGRMPKYAEEAWNEAAKKGQEIQARRRKVELMKQSLCGPECLAEILRRKGKKPDVQTLAKEMKTGIEGTSLLAMADTAAKHGLKAKGLALSEKGLEKQPLPLITLIVPGHYVILDFVTPKQITYWDPYANGPGKPGRISVPLEQWKVLWTGTALVFEHEK